MQTALSALLLFLTGLAAGIVGGFLGIGGCVIMLPTLYFLFHYSLPLAIGTTIAAVVITAASGAIAHIRLRNVDFNTVKIIAITGAIGSFIGSIIFLFTLKAEWILAEILGAAFLYVSIRILIEGIMMKRGKLRKGPELNYIPGGVLRKSLIGFFIGIISGIVGLGGGYALVPAFIYLCDAPVKLAVGTSLPSFISIAFVAALFKTQPFLPWLASLFHVNITKAGYVAPIAALCLGIGTAIGAQIGAKLVPKTPVWLIRIVFGVVFLAVAVEFIIKGLILMHAVA